MIVFDIETGPLEKLPPFDLSTVKLGNLKDPQKIAEKQSAAEQDYYDKAALSPMTGRVLAIGYQLHHDDGKAEDVQILGQLNEPNREKTAIEMFFWNAAADLQSDRPIVGFNSRAFDLPFLYRRALVLGASLPKFLIDRRGYWHRGFVDLLDVWRCGDRSLYVSLDALAAAFGLPGKLDGVSGADFATLWEEDRERAIAYVTRDVELTSELAQRMVV